MLEHADIDRERLKTIAVQQGYTKKVNDTREVCNAVVRRSHIQPQNFWRSLVVVQAQHTLLGSFRKLLMIVPELLTEKESPLLAENV